jgi:hypothetical protein
MHSTDHSYSTNQGLVHRAHAFPIETSSRTLAQTGRSSLSRKRSLLPPFNPVPPAAGSSSRRRRCPPSLFLLREPQPITTMSAAVSSSSAAAAAVAAAPTEADLETAIREALEGAALEDITQRTLRATVRGFGGGGFPFAQGVEGRRVWPDACINHRSIDRLIDRRSDINQILFDRDRSSVLFDGQIGRRFDALDKSI